MDIPEIRHRVGLFLGLHDRASCSYVSKDWGDTFTPLLYRSIELWSLETNRDVRWKGPSMTFLRSYSRRIRELTVHVEVYSSKVNLQDWPRDFNDYPADYTWLQDLLMNHPNIERLCIRGTIYSNVLSVLTKSCLALKELSLFGLESGMGDIVYILTHCKNLSALTIAGGCITHDDFQRRGELPKLLPSMKILEVRRPSGLKTIQIVDWATRCPELEDLSISGGFADWAHGTDFSVLGKCPKLARLEFQHLRLVNNELVRIFDGCRELTHLTLRGLFFNQNAYKALMRHFPTLKVLNLFNVHGLKSWLCGPILAKCPRLVELAWGDLDVDAIVHSERPTVDIPAKKKSRSIEDSEVAETKHLPWACKDLKTFKAASIKWSTTSKNNAFISRLGQFEHLQELLIGGTDGPFETQDTSD